MLRQQTTSISSISSDQIKATYVLKKKVEVNYNTWLLKFEREDGRKIVIPVGKHVRVFGTINGKNKLHIYVWSAIEKFEIVHAFSGEIENKICHF